MDLITKEVYFGEYCKTCKYEKCDPYNTDNPCCDCLNQPWNFNSHKPIKWVEKDE